ncbi:MAG: hypothetical protein RL385_1513 [Pseudomonadota bacterium]|jgi:hypothetical protein
MAARAGGVFFGSNPSRASKDGHVTSFAHELANAPLNAVSEALDIAVVVGQSPWFC